MPLREQERGGGRGQRKKEENATHPFLVLFAASASATSSSYSSRLSYSGPTPPLSSYPLSSSPFPPRGSGLRFLTRFSSFARLSPPNARERERRQEGEEDASEREEEGTVVHTGFRILPHPSPPPRLSSLPPSPSDSPHVLGGLEEEEEGQGEEEASPPSPSFDANEVAAGRGGGRGRRGRVEEGRRRRRHPSKWERTRRKKRPSLTFLFYS